MIYIIYKIYAYKLYNFKGVVMVIGYTFPNEISYYHHYIIYLYSLKPLLNIGKHTAVSSIPLQGGMHDILALNLTQKKKR